MKTCPIFRLAISLAAGIFFAETFRIEMGIYPVVALLFLLLALGRLLKESSYGGRWVFGAGAMCCMFLVGMVLTENAWKEVEVDWPNEKCSFRGVLQEKPQEKPKTYQCRVKVSDKDVLLYLPKDSLVAALKVGDEMLFVTQLERPRNQDDFQTFDYAKYLYHKGVTGVAYVPADAWSKTGRCLDGNLKLKALLIRERLVEKYRLWGIGERQMPVLSALTLGYKGDLDKETRRVYSVAGISHVLALSGMHIGILWFLLNGLLKTLLRGRLRFLEWGLVTMVLWAFAFVVGLEASVVRAVVMCMLMGLGRLSGGKPLSMNTLMVTAFFMLLYRPFYLFDVGFQLSFVAVASILIFSPLIFGYMTPRRRVMRWIWGTMAVSVAAQLGTAPLVMYYFSNFSVYFLLTNLVAAVLVPLIIYISILMIISSPFGEMNKWIVEGVNGLVEGLNHVVEWTSGLPYASFSHLVLTPAEIIGFYLFLASGLQCLKTRKRKWFIRTLAICACLLGLHLCMLVSR